MNHRGHREHRAAEKGGILSSARNPVSRGSPSFLCEAREISLAELARRGIDYILSVYAPEPDANRDWQPPQPRNLGWKGLSHAHVKAEAQLTNTEFRLTRRGRK